METSLVRQFAATDAEVGQSWVETLEDRVVAARAGDEVAFESIVDLVIDRMYTVARRIVGDPTVAEDAVQEALVRAWRDLRGLRDPERFERWLYRLLLRACFRVASRERRWRLRPLPVHPVGAAYDGESTLGDRDAMERVLAQLPAEHRAVVVLHHYADLPLTEVAHILGIPSGTARSRLHYALRRLRPLVEIELEGDGRE